MMRKRVFIVSFEDFPRNSAGANYIQYFALALLENDWDVVVLARHGDKSDYNEHCYKGIKYVSDSAIRTVKNRLYYNKGFYTKIAGQYRMSKEDYFVFYNSNIFLFHFFCKRFTTDNMSFIRVENRQPCQFKHGKLNPRYQLDKMAIRFAQNRMHCIFSISSTLMEQDKKIGANSVCLPILADPFEYQANIRKQKDTTVEFIYPGMKVTGFEDDLDTLFAAISSLPEDIRQRMRLHITGTSKEKIESAIKAEYRNKLDKVLVVHGFLAYGDLVELYKNMDYLLLIRHVNKITLANFPSKVPELMSYGVIPICTQVGDYTKDYLTLKCAFIIKESDVSGCADAIINAVDLPQNEYLQMREAARRLVEERLYYKHWSDFIEKNMEKKK